MLILVVSFDPTPEVVVMVTMLVLIVQLSNP